MARKAVSKKSLSEQELLGILSDTIRNVSNNTIETKQAREIFSGARSMCTVVQTKLKVLKHNAETNGNEKFLE